MKRTGKFGKADSVASLHRHAAAAALVLVLGVTWTAPALAHEGESPDVPDASRTPIDQALQEPTKGHGSVSIDYQNTYVNAFRRNSGFTNPATRVRIRSVALGLDYYFADRWSVYAGIPFVSNVYSGSAPHCPSTTPPQCHNAPVLAPPHPESQFLDDGQYHGAWQDWSLGVGYHSHIGDYYLTPTLTYSRPSHDYTFFANAAVGQHLWQVQPAIELAHQLELSNFYYRVRYSYVFVERTLNTSVNHHRLDLELGYFVNDKWSIRGFAVGKKGDGYLVLELKPLTNGGTNELAYHHDQISRHDYAAAGVGFDYHFGDHYTLSTSVQTLIWGQAVFNFKYSLDVRLTREF